MSEIIFGSVYLFPLLNSWGKCGMSKEIRNKWYYFSFLWFSSVAQSCLTLCNPMNRSTPGLPVHHQLPEFTQTHVQWVGDPTQPSHPLSSPFPPAPNPSQHQGLFQWVNSSHEVAKYWSFSFSIIPSKEHPGLISFRKDGLLLFNYSKKPDSRVQYSHTFNQLIHFYHTTIL